MTGLLSRPGLLAALLTVSAYWDPTALRGKYVYDDLGSIQKNVVVTGQAPWTDVFRVDYWGAPLSEPVSHKSFRPVTTLTFRVNRVLSDRLGQSGTDDETYYYHVVNVLLHGAVVFLATEAASFVFDGGTTFDSSARLVTGLLFGLHPVHAEAVSNITSRGELLMSTFFLLAFLSYASHVPSPRRGGEAAGSAGALGTIRYVLAVFVVPFLCMTMSLFSKEQGGTTLIALAAYDFIDNIGSLRALYRSLFASKDEKEKAVAISFLRRASVLAVQTLLVCSLRIWLNGESSPDFIFDQNPAAFSSDRFTRVMSMNWVYCLYIYDALYPKYLCCDWSGESIPLITRLRDVRILAVLALWAFVGKCLWHVVVGTSSSTAGSKMRQTTTAHSQREVLMAFFAFLLSPFLLSSNLLVVSGLMKGDRVVYLPLLGFCMMEALLFKRLFCTEVEDLECGDVTDKVEGTAAENQKDGTNRNGVDGRKEALASTHATIGEQRKNTSGRHRGYVAGIHLVGYAILILRLALLAAKTHERNIAWSSSLRLWTSALEVNPVSRHTRYNCGYELALDGQREKAEAILRPLAHTRSDEPSTTFVYTLVLQQLDRCDEARPLLKEALADVRERRNREREDGSVPSVREDDAILRKTESNLVTVQGLCTEDLTRKGKILFDAVQIDPTNEYAVSTAKRLLDSVEEAKKRQAGVGM